MLFRSRFATGWQQPLTRDLRRYRRSPRRPSMREDRHMRPNKDALQRTRPSRHCCNPRVSWAGSLSLGRCYVVKSWIMKVLELHPLSPMKSTSTILYLALGLAAGAADAPSSQPPDHYGAQARQVMEHIQKTFW